MPSSTESERLAASIRAIASKPEERAAFISEGVEQAKELQRKNIQEYENVLTSLLICLENFDVVQGSSLDIMCELTALDILYSFDLSAIQISQCNSYVRLCLIAANETSVAIAAAKTFSETLGFSTTTEFVRGQISDALDWVSSSDLKLQPRRVCGILILTEVALKVPTIILPKLNEIFDKLWDALESPDKDICSSALDLFSLCTKLLTNRPTSIRIETYDALLKHLKSNLASKSRSERIAGLLAFEPIVMSSIGSSTPLQYEDLSIMLVPFILGGRTTSRSDIRELLFRCLVVLCRCSTNLFIINQLRDTVRFALDSIKRNIQRSTALDMLSEIIRLVGKNAYDPFADETCVTIVDIFEEATSPCWEALKCFSIVCEVCQPARMESYVDACMDYVFSWGLSAQLIECMRVIIASSSTAYRTKLEESLLDMISITLCGLPFRQQMGIQKLSDMAKEPDPSDYQISVALNALMQFGFSNSELMGDFLRDSVLPFIDQPSAAVRNAAIYTIVKLLIPPGEKGDLSIARRICIDTVVSRMLVVGLSDPNPTVRETILSSFTEEFYPYLSEQQFLYHFYAALGDESINCRVAAVELLCRMINYNPSHILPALREAMIIIPNYITATFNMDAVRNGLSLLEAMASKAPQFITNFTESLLSALRPLFANLTPRSEILLPLLHCCTAVSKAMQRFGKNESPFCYEISNVCALLDAAPSDRSFYSVRLSCLRFLSATVGPFVDNVPTYQQFPSLFPQLSSILQATDENQDIRLEALRCIGVIGALDNFYFYSLTMADGDHPKDHKLATDGAVTQQRCCRVVLQAIAALLDPLNRRSSSNWENLLRNGLQTIMNIAERCPGSRAEMVVVLAPLSRVICELSGGRLLATVLFEYVNIIKFTREGSLTAVEAIYRVFNTVWAKQRRYRFLVVRMLSVVSNFEAEENVKAVEEYARIHPLMFDSINRIDSTDDLKFTVLDYIVRHAERLQGCSEWVVHNLLALIQNPSTSPEFATAAVVALKVVCCKLTVEELIGAVVRCLLATLSVELARCAANGATSPLSQSIMNVFCILLVKIQVDFLKYSAYITQTLKTYQLSNSEFANLNNQLANGARGVLSSAANQAQQAETAALLRKCDSVVVKAVSRLGEVWSYATLPDDVPNISLDEQKTLPIDEKRVLQIVKTSPLTREEWLKWGDQFSICMLQESPYQVFRCASLPNGINAASLVERSQQFTQDILQDAFHTLWTGSSATLRTAIIDCFHNSLLQSTSDVIPDEVLIVILSIIEHMDHLGEELSIPSKDISTCAWSRGMLAKALYCREAAYCDDPVDTVESLISLYSELHMVDSAVGILNLASEGQRRVLLQSNLVKLSRYSEALQLTEQELERCATESMNSSSTGSLAKPYGHRKMYGGWSRGFGQERATPPFGSSVRTDETAPTHWQEVSARLLLCLSELGEFEKVLEEWAKLRVGADEPSAAREDSQILQYVAQYAADASIRLQAWDSLQEVLKWMPQDTVFYHISNASLSIVNLQLDDAMASVTKGRKMILEDVSGLLHESYARAYEGLVVAQQLTEMEEVIAAKSAQRSLGSSDHIATVIKLWDQRIRMMLPTVPTWKHVLCTHGLLVPPSEDIKTRIRFVRLCRQESAKQLEKFTLEQLLGYTDPTVEQLMSRNANPRVVLQYITYLSASNLLGPDTKYGVESDLIKQMIDVHSKVKNSLILSRAYARLGTKVPLEESIQCFKAATLYDPKWYMAWRMWAETNTETLVTSYTSAACTSAIEGYIHSIHLGPSVSTLIQDVLKLLTLWSRHCDNESGLKELRNRVLVVPPRVWHLVVPQLIARLDSGSDESCHLVADIIIAVAKEFPHTLVYPLNLCTMSDSDRRKRWASVILHKLQDTYPIIVLEGRLMIQELIRISTLIHEEWYDKLEAAATAFFGRHSSDEMVRTLLPMHETIARAPETIVESEFICTYNALLTEAKEWLRSYTTTRKTADVQSAWYLYHRVYRLIDDQIKATNILKLQFCSPKLFEARDLALGVPDARPVSEESVSMISSFDDKLVVMVSKQRPKRISFVSTEGKTQKFLLKGKEDLRLDERVMQLFGLVNILMLSDSRSCKNFGFQIQRYSVTPLKDTAGLIGWVDGCDTLLEMVKLYRDRRGIPAELELRMQNQIITYDNSKAYDYLTIMSKVEVMEFLADNTSGQDIRKAMWSMAPSSEVWMERRHMYTTSLANMSMVGYILGLGDRHPNNIMMQRTSGLVVHIDFGDCFEVAMTRDKFPEKVPFRLTRMLRNALDVSGVGGAFRSNAETAMCVLQEGSHSVLALMEAFIQDPLISWRLVNRPGQEPGSSNAHKTIEEQMNVANMRTTTLAEQQESISVSVEAGRRETPSYSVAKQLLGQEVDVVHQGVFIFNRLSSKLKGQDFITSDGARSLDPKAQVARLIEEATDITNVAQSFSGWHPFW